MKLLNNLFEIVENTGKQSGFSSVIKIFPEHVVYQGHFPGYPVTPGVVLLQIVHELIENQLGRTIQLGEMVNCKFLKIVSPGRERLVTFSIDFSLKDRTLKVKTVGEFDAEVFLKLSGVYLI